MSAAEEFEFGWSCAAFLAAPLAPASIGALMFGSPVWAIPIFIVALLHVLFFAMPLYVLMARHWRPTFANVLAMSFLVGALPVVALMSLSYELPWYELVQAGGAGGLFGLSGGLLFWLVLSRAWRRGSCR
jgi:hypothetical protein